MYEKEIEECEKAVYYVFGETRELYYNIKKLLCAAQPKDEAAEREHCDRAARDLEGYDSHAEYVDHVMRERASARAEGSERFREIANELSGEIARLHREIAALKKGK